VPFTAYGLDQPHDPSQSPAVDCSNCHWTSGAANAPAWSTSGPTSDDTVNNKRCTQCHNGSPVVAAATHSTTTTGSTKWAVQGGWSAECIDCHNPHYQRQNRKWGSASHITTGTVSSIAAGNSTSNIIISAPLGTNYQDYYIIPNTALNMITYKIKNPTSGSSNITVQGAVDTTLVSPGDTFAIVYAKNIKDAITYNNPGGNTVGSATVKMFGPSGAFGPGDSTSQSTSICYVCHTLASPPATEPAHLLASAQCTSCHFHDVGFSATGACSSCHGYPPGSLITKSGAGTNVVSDSPGAGAHNAHIAIGQICDNCHSSGMTSSSGADNRINLGFSIAGANISGTYDGKSGRTTYPYSAVAPTTVTTGNTYRCSSVYCHSAGNLEGAANTFVLTGGSNYTTPQWVGGTALTCSGCHGTAASNASPAYTTGAAGSNTANSHAAHVSTQAYSCDNCHITTTASSTIPPSTLVASGTHLNKKEDVAFITARGGSNASYSATKVCANAYCHGSNSGQWGQNTTNATCTKCHGLGSTQAAYNGDPALAAPGINGTGVDTNGNSAANDPQVGAHNIHLRAAANISAALQCSECHAVVNTVNQAGHFDSPAPANVPLAGQLAANNPRAVAGAPYYDPAAKTCSNVYCHDATRFKTGYGGGNGYTPTWADDRYLAGAGANLTVSDCNRCHGYPPASTHSASTNCAQCHSNIAAGGANRTFTSLALHVNGIVEASGFCYTCHGAANNGDLSAGSNTGHQIHYASGANATSATQANDFSTGYAYNCNSCHPPDTASGHNMGANIPGVRVAEIGGTKITSYTNGSTNATDPRLILYGTNGSCVTVCHSRDGVAALPVAAPNWAQGKTGSCTYCHKASGESYATMTGADANKLSTPHGQHMASDRYAQDAAMFTCNTCHAGTAQNNTTINNTTAARTQHPNATKNVEFNATAGGNWSGTQCSSTYCHSNGTTAAGNHGVLSWSGSMNAECSSCHGGDAGATTKVTTNAHDAHTNDTTSTVGRNIACGECHNETVAAGNTRVITSYVYHTNKETNIAFDNGNLVKDADGPNYGGKSAVSTLAGGSNKAAGAAVASCANVYCHSTGNLEGASNAVVKSGAASNFKTQVWSGTLTCSGCHGDGAANAHPTYASGPAGSNTANSHSKHVNSSAFSCDYCHVKTTTNTALMPTSVVPAANGGTHLNRSASVDFKQNGGKNGVYNAAAKSCSSTYCHGDAASTAWGGAGSCAACHGATNNQDLSAGANTGHQIHYATGTAAVNATQNDDMSAGYAYGCKQCHPTASHALGSNVPGVRDADMTGLKMSTYTQGSASANDPRGFKYTTNGTCTTVCHTRDGVAALPVAAPNWAQGKRANNCTYCHKAAGDSYATMTGADANKLSTPHGQHMASDRYAQDAAMFGCATCHAGTALNNTTVIDSAGARNQHPNATKNVEFNATAGGNWSGTQCSSTYCHSNGTTAAGNHGVLSWSGSMNAECSSCHGGDAGATTKVTTNAHDAHTNDTTSTVGRNIACGECHNETVAAGNTRVITSYVYHTNKETNIAFDNGNLVKDADGPNYGGKSAVSTLAGGSNKAAGAAVASCANVYCHSTGNLEGASNAVVKSGAASNFKTQVWSGTLTCNGCHGGAAANQVHPTYASGTAGSNTANSHVAHVETDSITCDTCHINTTTSAVIPPTSVVSGGSHLNRVESVNFINSRGGTNATYSAAKVCSNTYCHGTTSDAWGTNRSANAVCTICHGLLSTAAAYNGDPMLAAPGINGTGVDTNGDSAASDPQVGAHNIHLRAAANISGVISCNTCHQVPATWGAANHNATGGGAEITFGQAATNNPRGLATSAFYNSGTKTCSNLYCHDGSRFKNGFGAGNGAQPVWSDTAYLVGGAAPTVNDCNKCHGFPPPPTHSTSTNCKSCHNNIAAGGANRTFIDNTLHMNGIVEGGGDCNSCHDYDTTGGGANWGFGSGGGLNGGTWGWGAHAKHINHLKTRNSASLNASTDAFGGSTFNLVCGVCHTGNEGADHAPTAGAGATNRNINFSAGSNTYQFGSSLPSFNPAAANRSCSSVDCHFKTTPQW